MRFVRCVNEKQKNAPCIYKIQCTNSRDGEDFREWLLKGFSWWVGDQMVVRNDEAGKVMTLDQIKSNNRSHPENAFAPASEKRMFEGLDEGGKKDFYKKQEESDGDTDTGYKTFHEYQVRSWFPHKEDDRKCYKCGAKEHLAKDCVIAEKCWICGGTDHKKADCKAMKCFACGGVGHMGRDCPASKEEKDKYQKEYRETAKKSKGAKGSKGSKGRGRGERVVGPPNLYGGSNWLSYSLFLSL